MESGAKLYTPRILLFRNSNGALSTFIRWQTDSVYSHAAIRISETEIVESWQGKGVQKIPYVVNPNIDEFFVAMNDEQASKIVEFAGKQVGNGYDYWGCLRFISRRNLPDNEKWFCSELVFASFKSAGINLLERIEPEQVSPGMLAHSPLLIKV